MDKGHDRQAGNAHVVWMIALVALCGCTLLAGCTSFMGQQDKRAVAQLLPTVGSQVRGTVSFVEHSDGVQVSYNLAGLQPDSDHALQSPRSCTCKA